MSAPMLASTSILCVIPGLIWPATGVADALSPYDLPGLSALLARVEEHIAPPCPLDAWLAEQFGLTGELPFAALRLAGDGIAMPDSDALWVCADPVSLRFARQHLLLDAPETLALQADEMDSLLRDLNTTFADIGEFSRTSPEHAYLMLKPEHADKLPVTLAPLADVDSRPVAQFQAKGEHAAWWSKLNNELQVFCHNHPVNTAREARRAPALNALWLWGLGSLPPTLASPHPQMAARQGTPNAIFNGLSRLAHCKPAAFDARQPAAWSLIDDLHAPAQQRDTGAWSNALQKLDAEVFVPLVHQLRSGRLHHLRIVAPGDTALTRLDISPTPRWKFWQRGASKAQLIARLGRPAE
ncbi:hypothetical protein VVD49_18040 [Uliginosibacterium sp. H3]|uniref:Phosphoglycerate mutase n=1 Tax=Uliginosibacterium silvisoli TaxID=3114758 RepID=A0ABU6K6W5_9RHOO|nr:hypothetical protein [Uliginosibacterium sp. H3]